MPAESLAPHVLESGKRVFGLDVARATAIWMVFICHLVALGDLKQLHPAWALDKLWLLGLTGVDLFFVLSGYLIGKIVVRAVLQGELGHPRHLRYFWMRRWMRTMPAYVVWFFIYQFWSHPGVPLSERVAALLCVSNFSQHTLPTFGQSWSLMVEEWFYLLFPLWLFILLGLSGKPSRRVIVAAALPFLIIPLVLKGMRWHLSIDMDDAFRYVWMVTPLRLDSIMIGVLAAVVVNRFPQCRERLGKPWLQAGYAFFGFAIYMLVLKGRCSWFAAFTWYDLLFAIWVMGLDRASANPAPSRAFGRKFVILTSKLAYSLYLCHVILWETLAVNFHFYWAVMPIWSVDLLFVVAAYLVAWVSYQCVERPFLAWRERLRDPQVTPTENVVRRMRLSWLGQGAVIVLALVWLIPRYYQPVCRARLRLQVANDSEQLASVKEQSGWGRSYPSVTELYTNSAEGFDPPSKLQITLPESLRWLQDYLVCHLNVTIPEFDAHPPRKGKFISDGAVCVEVHARQGKQRTLVLRRRLDVNDVPFGWQHLNIPLQRSYDKLEVTLVQYALPAPDNGPRLAWLSW